MKQAWENGISMYSFYLEMVRTNPLPSVEYSHCSYFWYSLMVRSLSNIIKLWTHYCEARLKMRNTVREHTSLQKILQCTIVKKL